MTKPVFYYPQLAAQDGSGEVTLRGEEAHHMRVKRIQVGEEVDLVDGDGWRAHATLRSVAEDGYVLAIEAPVNEGQGETKLVLVQALVKGSKDEQVVEMATEVGASAIIAWQAQRSISRWASAKVPKQLKKLRDSARAAAKQSRRSTIPTVDFAGSVQAVVDKLKEMGGELTVLVAHEEGEETIERALATSARTEVVAVVIGPEGGITPSELQQFTQAGAKIVKVGSTVMRAITAGVVTLALTRSAWQQDKITASS
ncbi:MAG: 16S rRNA (uracil(1498)-N(3))-methyltransferase [Actinomycetaceae bacterium]|nr:16S rRNA (uracil(1498)-N(3))-methyltransferase [Actinomycetaceae bacterium]